MKKIAVITDSNAGMLKEETDKLGVIVVPMPFTINGEDYFEGVNLSQEEFYEKLKGGADVSTSMPSPGTLIDLFEEKLKDYDEIVYIPMSSGLSGSCAAAASIAEDYDNRIQVVDNRRISVTQRQSVLRALDMAAAGAGASDIKRTLEEEGGESSIYIMLDTLHYLKKGGRITPAVAAIGTLLHIRPVLQIQGDKLDTFSKARTIAAGKKVMLEAVREDGEKRFGGISPDNVMIAAAYTYDKEAAAVWKNEIMEAFPGFDVYMAPLSLSVSCHIGPGALAMTITKI